MLIYFDPIAICDHEFKSIILGPLPARRNLWEASDELAWKMGLEKDFGAQTAFGLAKSGELIVLEDDHSHKAALGPRSAHDAPSLRNTADWEEWCSGMDGLGGLVMLAASLVG